MTEQGQTPQTFDFGARPAWTADSPQSPNDRFDIHEIRRRLPGSFVRDDPPPAQPVLEVEEEPPAPAPPQPAQNPEKTCRICLSGPEDGRLISPCKCRGTMKFVHLTCLNSWRYASPNTKSVYQCDQCGYKYHFTRTEYAAIVGSVYTRIICTVLVFVLAVFLSGFIFKFILYLTGATLPFTKISSLLDLLFGIDPIDEMSSIDLDTWGYRPPQTLNEVFFSGFSDAAHWALGVIGLALYGFVSVMAGMGAFGVHLRLGNWRRRQDRRRVGTLGGIMWGIVILVGTSKMLKAIYRLVDGRIRRYQVQLETAILEVDPDGQ